MIAEPTSRVAIAALGAETMFGYDEAQDAERVVLEQLEHLPAGGVLVIDFNGVRIASEAARQLLRRALLRVSSGEHQDRFLVLSHLERCHYSVEAMLRREELTAIERTPTGPRLIGKQDRVATETFAFVASKEEVTAKMVAEHFGLPNIAAATNRLTTLARSALVRRMGPRPLPTGGREYVFSAVQ